MAELVPASTLLRKCATEVGADGSGLEKMKLEANLKAGAFDVNS